MVLFRTAVLALTSAIVVSADYYVVPSTVPLATRMSWCNDERSTCPLICQQFEPHTTLDNSCDAETLTYGCLCGNNQQPNVSEYSLTLPYHVCQEWGNQCVTNCGPYDNTCSSNCRQQHPCGAQRPTRANTTTSTTMTSTSSTAASTTSNQVFNGLGGGSSSGSSSGSQTTDDASSSSTTNSGAMALEMGSAYGLAVVLASMFAGFAMML
ncbi:hypothetical protein B0T17DRAFT_509967 [Bombardia bombarda]|uniref:DUF7707 domain-containing protein n=1 Tax=Bombardia bombarda TaxID=252184 RepID=A0AA40BYD5_9PEZI|nr:hypothetical protein B0T17DRAFT_509967 [Bombardia bombarda]